MTKKRARELTLTHFDGLFSSLIVAPDPPSTECVEVLQRPIETVPMYRYSVDDFVGLRRCHGHQCLWPNSTVLEGSHGPLESLGGPSRP